VIEKKKFHVQRIDEANRKRPKYWESNNVKNPKMAEKLKIFGKRHDGLDPVSPTNNVIKINDHELGLLVEES